MVEQNIDDDKSLENTFLNFFRNEEKTTPNENKDILGTEIIEDDTNPPELNCRLQLDYFSRCSCIYHELLFYNNDSDTK